MKDHSHVHERIRTLRKFLGLTHLQFARSLGVSARTAARWEAAIILPDGGALTRMREAFGVDLHWLLIDGFRPGYLQEVRLDGKQIQEREDGESSLQPAGESIRAKTG